MPQHRPPASACLTPSGKMSGDGTSTPVTQETARPSEHRQTLPCSRQDAFQLHPDASLPKHLTLRRRGEGNLKVSFLLWQQNTSLCLYSLLLLVFIQVCQVVHVYNPWTHLWLCMIRSNKIFYLYFIKTNGSHKAATFAEVKQTLKRTSNFDCSEAHFGKPYVIATWALQPDSATHQQCDGGRGESLNVAGLKSPTCRMGVAVANFQGP